jgi:hypothetical protein
MIQNVLNRYYNPKDIEKLEKYPVLQTKSGKRFCSICSRRFRLKGGFENNCKHCGGKQ